MNFETKKLIEICDIECGTRVVRKVDGGSIYPVYGGGGATFKMDTYNREDCLVVARFAMSETCTRIVKGKFFLNDSGLTLKAKENVITQEYLETVILGKNDEIYGLGRGAAQKNLDMAKFRDLEISYPTSLEEQKRIVKILDEKFAMLETVKANAQANLQNAKDLFQSQLTKAFSNSTWEKKRLGDICLKIGSGATPKGGKENYKSEGIHLVRSMNVYDNEFIYDELACLDDNQANELRNVELKEDDVLFNITGASVCRCCVLPSDVLPARVNQHVSILRPDHKILNPLFLCYLMIGPYHEELYKMACSGGSTRQAITKKQLEDFEVYVPSLEEQKIMIDKIDSLSQKVRSLEEIYTKQLANCDELKQAFLAKAFAGEL